MRSYYAHIQAMAPETTKIASRPVFRSSAIFPVLHESELSTRLLFLGYWMLKRNIEKIAAIVTLRSLDGKILTRVTLEITEPKAYSFELEDFLEMCDWTETSFKGSLEIEFYSNSNLVFPYPAVVVNYYGPSFSSVVHTAQRVYNDYDDMQKNSQTAVPESGFNIKVSEGCEPFIGLINGADIQENAEIKFQFFNHLGGVLEHLEQLGTLRPYETKIIYPARHTDLESFLQGQEGACKAAFNVKWIFPRLLVGNQQTDPSAVSVTHTYYDCSSAASESDYWRYSDPEWHTASLMLPLWLDEDHFTDIYFYPIYSPSTLAIDVELYTEDGILLGSKEESLILESPCDEYAIISFKKIAQELNIRPERVKAARIIARSLAESLVPSRIKLALNIGHNSKGLPCNICMNLQPYNPSFTTKKSSFKWLPFLADQPFSSIWLMNSSPKKNDLASASVEITFFREKDNETLKRNLQLPPHGSLVITRDEELDAFFESHIGWITVVTNNPYLTTYYFADNSSGVVGGDHGF